MRKLVVSVMGAAILWAPPAGAQDSQSGEVATQFAELFQQLKPVADAAGLSPQMLEQRIAPLVRAAVPTRADDGKTWGYAINFDSHEAVATAGGSLEAEPNHWTALKTAQACAATFTRSGDVVHFARFRRGALVGHTCMQAAYQGDAGFLVARTFIEGADRRFTSTYIAGASMTGHQEELRRLFEPVVENNIALATAIADLGITALEKARPGNR